MLLSSLPVFLVPNFMSRVQQTHDSYRQLHKHTPLPWARVMHCVHHSTCFCPCAAPFSRSLRAGHWGYTPAVREREGREGGGVHKNKHMSLTAPCIYTYDIHIIGASLSKPHTSGTALRKCVYVLAAIYRKFKWAHSNISQRSISCTKHVMRATAPPECSIGDPEWS